MSRFKLFIPLIIFLLVAPFLWRAIGHDPSVLPSALVGKPLPDFSLPSIEDPNKILTKTDLLNGEPFLLNVWATWCVSCRVEHPYLVKLAQQGVTIHGLDYKDDRVEAMKLLQRFHDPYQINLFDELGKLVLDLGVYGAPETFLVDADGIIRYRHVGVVNEEVWRTKLAPLFHGGRE